MPLRVGAAVAPSMLIVACVIASPVYEVVGCALMHICLLADAGLGQGILSQRCERLHKAGLNKGSFSQHCVRLHVADLRASRGCIGINFARSLALA